MSYQTLLENNIIVKGDFTLKSGKKSDYYVDIKKTISIPFLFNQIINGLCNEIKLIPNLDTYAIIGVPYSGIPFGSVVSYKLFVPFLLLRQEQKNYGTKKRIEGETLNKKIILIEDVMTTGKSILETVTYLSNLGYQVKYVYTIFQRGDIDYIEYIGRGINYNYLIRPPITLVDKLKELIPYHSIYNTITNISRQKQTNIILSVDVPNIEEFKQIIYCCGNYIMGLKIHLDIFNEEDRDNIRNFLIEQKVLKNFLVIEDRKFSDICQTNLQQFNALEIQSYADIIISHAISGFEFIKMCPLPVLVVSQMSNKGNLISRDYTKQCVDATRKYTNIIGLISQQNLGYNKCIYCKPGIRVDVDKDNHDQCYTGRTAGIDFYIVGRGITQYMNNHETMLNQMKYYKEYLWD